MKQNKMEPVMLSRPKIISEYAGFYRLSIALLAVLVFLASAGSELLAQGNNGAPAAGPEATDLKIEVLEVTTGSGSKSQAPDKPPLKIEVMDAGAGPGQTKPSVSTSPRRAKNAQGTAAETEQDEAAIAQREALFAALDRWHYDTLAAYNYNIPALADPFMPIQEVRGQPPLSKADAEAESRLPPLLRLELNQLKMVAITYLSERQGAAWVSFEDGAGNSYILREGDRVGRNHGRITKIAPNEVWVEERGRSGKEPPKNVTLKLNVLDTQGMTRTESAGSGAALQTLSVPGE